ncbi:hypothetical protein N7510_007732 [Penicillium lagena]|uniref:uncharacterized protein n=1 Tax=Penicillium lagena TaxID=94218 RepID=UPI00254035FB|nr:uncharacterized protein N7510_007732 [Penicillium lagena]KAJ5611013.1 hypothetical protein N7510_007732 [Penicillium lagena]
MVTASQQPTSSSTGPSKAKKKRIRNWTAEDRAVHRQFEKSRREAFSERLLELVRLIPILKEETRPSKHIIIDASISYHKTQQSRCSRATETINALIAERNDLLQEVNALRALYRSGACEPRQARPLNPTVQDMLAHNDMGLVSDPAGDITSNTMNRQLDSLPQAPLPRKSSPLTRQQARLPTPAAGPHESGVSATPADPVLLSLSPGINIQSPGDWAWVSSGNPSHPILAHSNLPGDTAPLWNQIPDISSTTPPKDATMDFDHNPSHLIDDTALFWTQYPSILTTTSPLENRLRDDTNQSNIEYDSTFDWHHNPNTPNTTPLNAHGFLHQSGNQFPPNIESLDPGTEMFMA